MSKQKLNLSAVSGIQEINDRAAEIVSGGSFGETVTYNDQTQINRIVQGDNQVINLSNVDRLDFFNIDVNANDPNAMGNTFGLQYLNAANVPIMTENINGVGQVTAQQLTAARNAQATQVLVHQYYEFCEC